MAVEELTALLADLEARAEDCWPGGEGQCRGRRTALAAYAGTLRRVIGGTGP